MVEARSDLRHAGDRVGAMTSSQRTYRGLSPQERTAKRRAALLEAALDTVAAPEREVSVRSICSQAALTPRYFYESFPSLDHLLVALIDEITAEIFRHGASAAAEATDLPLEEQCRAAFRGAWAPLRDDARKAGALLVLASGREVLQERRRAIVLEYTDGALAFLAARYDLGRIDQRRARSAVLFSVAGTFELVLAHLSGTLGDDEEELADDVARLMAQCLRVLGLPLPD